MPRLQLSFLGEFSVDLNGRRVTRFRSAKNQGLLVYLACQSETPISRETLAAVFWPDETEKAARHNLRQALYRLRGLFGEQQDTIAPFLLVTRQAVQFNPEADFVLDVTEFTTAVDHNELIQASACYAGDLLPGFPCESEAFEAWLRQKREYLHELALEVWLQLAEDSLRSGDYGAVIRLAQRQLMLDPWREQAFRQLMKAYALMGERGKAVLQYDRCREILWVELGVQPAMETSQLFEEISSGRFGRGIADSPLQPPRKTRHNLPASATSFVGRQEEIAAVCALFSKEDQRLVTIIGPGGMGKTRLALEIGTQMLAEYLDGLFFVDLSSVADPEEIAGAIATAMSYHAPDPASPLLPQLINSLDGRHVLLILDNFEQLLAGAPLLDQMMQALPRLSLLVTSRQTLYLASENRYRLQGLEFPDLLTVADAFAWSAVRLFVNNGRRTRPDFALTEENVVYILQICRLVQGMPLALILAATWLELLEPADIAVEIEKSLEFLAANLADLPSRQRSISAVFDRSWQRLTTDEQAVLAKLSVFRGGFTRTAAEQVAGANLRILLSLSSKSFLQRQEDQGRYVMHELLRQYCETQLEQLGLDQATRLAHCLYFSQIVPRELKRVLFFEPLLLPADHAADRDNFFSAWAFALARRLPELLADLSSGIICFGISQGIFPGPMIDKAVTTVQAIGVPADYPALLQLRAAQLQTRQFVYDTTTRIEQIMAFIEELKSSDQYELRYWLCIQVAMQWRQGGGVTLFKWLDEAESVAEAANHETLKNIAIGMRLFGQTVSGQYVEGAFEKLRKLQAYFKPRYPDSYILYGIYHSLSLSCGHENLYAEAVDYGNQGLEIALHWRELRWIRLSCQYLAKVHDKFGRHDLSAAQQLRSLDWHVALGSSWQLLSFIANLLAYSSHFISDDNQFVELLWVIDNHPESTDYYRHLIREQLALKRQKMDRNQYLAAWARGRSLTIDDAVARLRQQLSTIAGQV